MTIKDCVHCGGTHYGSTKCPYLCERCGKDIRKDEPVYCTCLPLAARPTGNNGPRYQARHLMDEAIVLDTLFFSKGVSGRHRCICECDDIEAAKLIARALNREAMS